MLCRPRHVEHRQSTLLGEHGILHMVLLGKGKVVLRGKAPVGRHLPGHATIQFLLPLEHRPVLLGVGRITTHDQTIKDHGGAAAREKDLVPVLGLTALLDDDVGVILEEGDHLLRGGNLLSLEDPPVGLVDHLVEDADGARQFLG